MDITVKFGDTISGLAVKYHVSEKEIIAANGINNPNSIRIGQKLIIPEKNNSNITGLDTFTATTTKETEKEQPVYHTVKPNEVLGKIAQQYDISINDLLAANPHIKDVNKIYPGMILKIPSKSVDEKPEENNPSKYTIKKGDNFDKIERTLFLKPGQLHKANPNINPKKLKIGDVINIPEKEYYYKAVDKNDKKFESFLSEILKFEKGYRAAQSDGSDKETNKGITKTKYEEYLKNKAFDNKTETYTIKSVKNITDEEIKEIYYNDFYLASGADKITDKKTAFWVMDTAVNCGVKKAKDFYSTCGTDNQKWYDTRKKYYEDTIEKFPLKAKFKTGWISRIDTIKDFKFS